MRGTTDVLGSVSQYQAPIEVHMLTILRITGKWENILTLKLTRTLSRVFRLLSLNKSIPEPSRGPTGIFLGSS